MCIDPLQPCLHSLVQRRLQNQPIKDPVLGSELCPHLFKVHWLTVEQFWPYACNDMVCCFPRFVDKLYTIQPGENEAYLPSPEALREKILVKVSDATYFPY